MQFRSGVVSALVAGLSLVGLSAAVGPTGLVGGANKRIQLHGTPGWEPPVVPISGNTTFQQLIDHDNPGMGTFSQFYYYNDTFWKPGGPIILFTPGEIAALGYTNYLTPRRLTGAIAEAVGGAIIVLEHRYWGVSSPYSVLTPANLTYLTLDNAIADLVHFAKSANLPFDPDKTSAPDSAPWLLVGGSYSGALTAWTASTAPGTFWAYLATSAVTQAQKNLWQYYEVVREGMPRNCSKDTVTVIEYVDQTLAYGSAKDIYNLKAMFGFQDLEHNDDFASALGSGVQQWQSNQFYSAGGIYSYCDFVEGANGTNPTLPGPQGLGLQKALANYAYWVKDVLLPYSCSSTNKYDVSCWSSYDTNTTTYTDTTVGNAANRQWMWMLCNEPFGFWQDSAPPGVPSLISRLVTPAYFQRQCGNFFGTDYGSFRNKRTEAQVNKYTGGWNFTGNQDTRIWWTNGQYDPWRDVTVSSDFRPGGRLQTTEAHPVRVIKGGFHCSDLLTMNGAVNAGVAQIQKEEVAKMVQWVGEWPGKK